MSLFLTYYLFIKKIFNYIKLFGLVKGVQTHNQLLTLKKEIFPVFVPSIHRNIYLRGGTSDVKVFEQIFIKKHYNLPISANPKVIIDAGANIGLASLFFLSKFPNANIIAIEPEGSNFEMLSQNIKGLKNIIAIKAGLWYKEAFLNVKNPFEDKFGFVVTETTEENSDFKGITLSQILNDYKLDAIDILKIDIEGAEKDIFLKSESWINKVKIIIVELHENISPGCTKVVYNAIKHLNFKELRIATNIIFYK